MDNMVTLTWDKKHVKLTVPQKLVIECLKECPGMKGFKVYLNPNVIVLFPVENEYDFSVGVKGTFYAEMSKTAFLNAGIRLSAGRYSFKAKCYHGDGLIIYLPGSMVGLRKKYLKDLLEYSIAKVSTPGVRVECSNGFIRFKFDKKFRVVLNEYRNSYWKLVVDDDAIRFKLTSVKGRMGGNTNIFKLNMSGKKPFFMFRFDKVGINNICGKKLYTVWDFRNKEIIIPLKSPEFRDKIVYLRMWNEKSHEVVV